MNEASMTSQIEQIQQAAGCHRSQAWAALSHCNGDAKAAIELARRLAPSQRTPGTGGVHGIAVMPSAEVLSMMYPACREKPADYTRRLKVLADMTGARPQLVIASLRLCQGDVGAAMRLLVV